jgi:Flp pilus assembly protein TadD
MKRNDLILSLLLLAAVATAYGPAYRGAFIWDDDRHVSENVLLRSADGLRSIWFDVGTTPQYYPLTHTTFWLEWQLWGANVLGYHIVNVVLHAIASLLVVVLMRRWLIPGAWLAGFVFALHPLHVESVAWISERKNTLSIVFALAMLIVYPLDSVGREYGRRWAVALVLFFLAVLSKTVVGVLPAVVLVVIWWKRGRIKWADIHPLIPFFVVAIAAAILTGGMERRVVGAEGEDWSQPLIERTLLAGRAIWWYAGKLVWPAGLAFSYERWIIDITDWRYWAWLISAIGVVVLAIAMHRRIGRGVATGLLIFGGVLFPALGFFNLFPHRYSYVADHFQYHANVALIILLCSGLAMCAARMPRWASTSWAIILFSLLWVMSFEQSKIYRDQQTLWRDTIARTPTSWLAHFNLAVHLTRTSDRPADLQEVLDLLDRTSQLRPQHDGVDWARGDALKKLGRTEEASEAYDRAESLYRDQVAADPNAINPHIRLGRLLVARSDEAAAFIAYAAASDQRPDISYFAEEAGKWAMIAEDWRSGIVYLSRWATLRPRSVDARMRLAFCYGRTGRFVDARQAALEALALDPKNSQIQAALDSINHRLKGGPTSVPSTSPKPAGETSRE